MALKKQEFTYLLGELTLHKDSKLDMQKELMTFFKNCIYQCPKQFDLDTHTRYQISFSINDVGFEASEKLHQFFTHLKHIDPSCDIKFHAGINFY